MSACGISGIKRYTGDYTLYTSLQDLTQAAIPRFHHFSVFPLGSFARIVCGVVDRVMYDWSRAGFSPTL